MMIPKPLPDTIGARVQDWKTDGTDGASEEWLHSRVSAHIIFENVCCILFKPTSRHMYKDGGDAGNAKLHV